VGIIRRNRPVRATQIASEALTLAGGGRALLLQIAHPAVGRGVVEHSDFSERLMDRFDGTMLYLSAAMFGTPKEVAAMRRVVNQAHVPVHGDAAPGRPAYSAFDAELQLWVASTLYQTMMELHRRVFGDLTAEQADEAYREFARALSSLQLTEERWPATRSDFDGYWERMMAGLRVEPEVLAVSRQILQPRHAPWWLRRLLPVARLVTAGLLPERLRHEFHLPWNERRQRRFDRVIRWTAAVYPRLPLRLRHLPRDRYLARLRRTVGPGDGSAER
jgi:uncharacterized protein (DUF2236 family)